MTLREICETEFDGNITPDMMIEFAFSGEEENSQLEYLDEILETHGDTEVEWYNVPGSGCCGGHHLENIKVLFKKED